VTETKIEPCTILGPWSPPVLIHILPQRPPELSIRPSRWPSRSPAPTRAGPPRSSPRSGWR